MESNYKQIMKKTNKKNRPKRMDETDAFWILRRENIKKLHDERVESDKKILKGLNRLTFLWLERHFKD